MLHCEAAEEQKDLREAPVQPQPVCLCRAAHSSGKDTIPAFCEHAGQAVIGACYCFRLDNTQGVSEPAGETRPL